MGLWHELKPKNFSKRDAHHEWLFAHYIETPSEREDGRWYHAFYFRNQERTCFGVKEFDDLRHTREMERLAARVLRDPAFRQSLISDDPELVKLWKRR